MNDSFFHRMGPVRAVVIPASILILLSTAVRLILLAISWKTAAYTPDILLKTFWAGFRFDLFMSIVFMFPLVLYTVAAPGKFLRSSPSLLLTKLTYFSFLCFFIFQSIVEIAFFLEFDARFNYIAVEYLIYPTEVANNIWESYPVLWIVSGVLLAAAIIYRLTHKALEDRLIQTASFPRRLAGGGLVVLIGLGLYVTLGIDSTSVSSNRVNNEIAGNSYYDLFFSYWSNDLNYFQYYRTMYKTEAIARVRELLKDPEGHTVDFHSPNPLEQTLTEDGPLRDTNFVILVEESFGASFTGVLEHNPENLTPNFDKLAGDGILFTNFYATGSRTVRGLEAILCGFPPVPGESILKRDKSGDIFTLASILKSKEYETLFIYGGRGIFDNMRSFMTANGFDRFIEQKDFKNPSFTTAWGVCDEDIFHRAISEMDDMDRQGKRFFTTVLSVSNHKPYTYPVGRIDLDPEQQRRQNAVKYADWALGDFFEQARKYPFFKKTVFVVIGDHGARVYGADFIPITSYEVPFLIYAPGRLKPQKIDTLACSMDVAPTLMGLTDFTYHSVFFGRDLFDVAPEQGFALFQHDRDIGYLRKDKLVVLGLMDSEQVYRYDRSAHTFSPVHPLTEEDKGLILDGTAVYQTAYDLYKNQSYHLNGPRNITAKPLAANSSQKPSAHP